MAENTVTTERRNADDVRRALEPWLAAKVPGQTVEDLRVAAPEGHGFSNDTLIIDAIVDGAPMPLVCQAAPLGPGLFPDYPIARMATIQRDLRDHSDVPVANVRWLEEDPAVLGAPFYVMDKVDGDVPDESPPYPVSGWVHEATADGRRTMWLSLLDAMAKLARLDVHEHFSYLTGTRWGMPLDADPAPERVRQWREFTMWASADDRAPADVDGGVGSPRRGDAATAGAPLHQLGRRQARERDVPRLRSGRALRLGALRCRARRRGRHEPTRARPRVRHPVPACRGAMASSPSTTRCGSTRSSSDVSSSVPHGGTRSRWRRWPPRSTGCNCRRAR